MRIDLVNIHRRSHAPADLRLPFPYRPKRGEIRDQRGGSAVGEEPRDRIDGVAAEEEEGDPEIAEAGMEDSEAAEHESELTGVGAEKAVEEVEDDGDGGRVLVREMDRVDQSPVVDGALIAEHPIHHGMGGGGRTRRF